MSGLSNLTCASVLVIVGNVDSSLDGLNGMDCNEVPDHRWACGFDL